MEDQEIKKSNPTLGITLWSVGSILCMLATPLFMYVVYAIAVKSNPEVSLTTGYWVGFIFILVPLFTIFYGYSRKLHDKNDKRYLACYITGILAVIVILLFAFMGLALNIPLN